MHERFSRSKQERKSPKVFIAMSSAAQNLYTTAAEYLEGESNSDHWKKHIYTQSGSLVHLQSSDHTLPVSASYQSAAFP